MVTTDKLTQRHDNDIVNALEAASRVGVVSGLNAAWYAGFEAALSVIMTTDHVAKELGVTPRRVRALAKTRKAGRLIYGTWFFLPSDIERLRPGKPGRPRKVSSQ